MANVINVTFLNPTTDQSMEVQVDDSMTATAVLNELISSGFIPDNAAQGGYSLLVKTTQKQISGSQTLAEGGAVSGSPIRVIPATDAERPS